MNLNNIIPKTAAPLKKLKPSHILIFILLILILHLSIRSCKESTQRANARIETKTITKTDTLIIRDTLRIDSIQIKEKLITQYITRTDTLTLHDTIKVPIPISTYTWRDSLYHIKVEGYKVKPLQIDIFPETKYVYQTQTVTNNIKPRRWSLGINAGYGVMLTPGGSFYHGVTISLGISYRIF